MSRKQQPVPPGGLGSSPQPQGAAQTTAARTLPAAAAATRISTAYVLQPPTSQSSCDSVWEHGHLTAVDASAATHYSYARQVTGLDGGYTVPLSAPLPKDISARIQSDGPVLDGSSSSSISTGMHPHPANEAWKLAEALAGHTSTIAEAARRQQALQQTLQHLLQRQLSGPLQQPTEQPAQPPAAATDNSDLMSLYHDFRSDPVGVQAAAPATAGEEQLAEGIPRSLATDLFFHLICWRREAAAAMAGLVHGGCPSLDPHSPTRCDGHVHARFTHAHSHRNTMHPAYFAEQWNRTAHKLTCGRRMSQLSDPQAAAVPRRPRGRPARRPDAPPPKRTYVRQREQIAEMSTAVERLAAELRGLEIEKSVLQQKARVLETYAGVRDLQLRIMAAPDLPVKTTLPRRGTCLACRPTTGLVRSGMLSSYSACLAFSVRFATVAVPQMGCSPRLVHDTRPFYQR